MEQKSLKISIAVAIILSLLMQAAALGLYLYRSTTVALVVAQQQGYNAAMNEVNQMVKDGKLTVNNQPITTPVENAQ